VIILPNNWADLQHYKDRSPPWIKLHKKLLDNFEFQTLPVASKALAPMLWLLASEHDNGEVDATPKKLAFRLRMTEVEASDALKPLIDNGFFSVVRGDSGSLAERKQSAMPETEGEAEKEAEAEKKPSRKRAAASPDVVERPEDVSEQVWKDWVQLRKSKRTTASLTAIDGAREEAAKANLSLEGFLKVWVRRGSQGLEADWLRPNERGAASPTGETPYQRQMRERMQQAAPGVAARGPGAPNNVIDLEAIDVTARRLG